MKNRKYCFIAALLFFIIESCSPKTVEYYYQKEIQTTKQLGDLIYRNDQLRRKELHIVQDSIYHANPERLQFFLKKRDSLDKLGGEALIKLRTIDSREDSLRHQLDSIRKIPKRN